jgi:TRAP-type C4-dicarboxylate transport system permease small subunit
MIHPVRNSGRCDSKPSGASNPTKIILGPDPAAEQRAVISNGVNRWEGVDEVIARVEQTLLVTFLGFMIVIAFLQIVLRNFFFTGLDWGDSLLRNLVLWVGFVGATLATKEGKHINIDIVSRWLPPLGKNIVTLITHLFSFLICCALTNAALKFIKNEVEMGNRTFLNIPAWIPEMILPVTFILMTFRFGLRSFEALSGMAKTGPPHDREKEA